MINFERDEFEILEGTVVKFKYFDQHFKEDRQTFGRIVGCDPDIGITIISCESSSWYLFCSYTLNSPYIRNQILDRNPDQKSIEAFKLKSSRIFKDAVEMIRTGIFDSTKLKILYEDLDDNPSIDDCAFA